MTLWSRQPLGYLQPKAKEESKTNTCKTWTNCTGRNMDADINCIGTGQ